MNFEFIIFILCLAGGALALVLLGIIFEFILMLIPNDMIRTIIFTLLCILFLPAMLTIWARDNISSLELKYSFIRYDTHVRSRTVVMATIVYIFIYYFLYQRFFT